MDIKYFLKQYPDAKPIVPCERCHKNFYGYYTLSFLTKGFFVICPICKIHTRPFIDNLPIPYKPSKHYLKHTGNQFTQQGMGNAESV